MFLKALACCELIREKSEKEYREEVISNVTMPAISSMLTPAKFVMHGVASGSAWPPGAWRTGHFCTRPPNPIPISLLLFLSSTSNSNTKR